MSRTKYSHQIDIIDNIWIPLSDGTRLSATAWLPKSASTSPVPALLEFLPYRKDDNTAREDSRRHPYFAGFGYGSFRVDMRGSGNSDGILEDEYLPREQRDAAEVIAWLSSQQWCSGAVGMFGISWGGFNSLQVAARRPPALKAIVTLCSSDDRYATDVHYNGGCVMGDYLPFWAAAMLAFSARPPDPTVVGDRWRPMWFDRLEKARPLIETWLSRQRRDDYWKQGSVCEDYSSIVCPVLAVGGWADPYTDTVLRLLAGLKVPRLGIIGPWGHGFPQEQLPGPTIGFLQECLRWWDYWLKGIDTGIMDEPMLRAWMQYSFQPNADHSNRSGRWVAVREWPPPDQERRSLFLNQDRLGEQSDPGAWLEITGRQSTGANAGAWIINGFKDDFPLDQRPEDAASLTFTSKPLVEPCEILGSPRLTVKLSADQPYALISVRLCDVAADGESSLVTRGLLNLTHRDSHEHPAPLESGKPYTVTVPLGAIAHTFATGHRIRVGISPTYWPWAWPSPHPVALKVSTGTESRLELPMVDLTDGHPEIAFASPEVSGETPTEVLHRTPRVRLLEQNVSSGEHRIVVDGGAYVYRLPAKEDLEVGSHSRQINTISEGAPLSAAAKSEWTCTLERGDWHTRVNARIHMTSTTDHFLVTNVLDAYENDQRIFGKTWTFRINRDHV